jgi:DNA invertase Pin-like site-specific DNA recombinase
MTAAKIQSTHCERMAFVYVRQSTPLQVVENRESTERQYHLRDRAVELGWPPSHVEVIDEDQGRSGSTAAHRTGFQRLASEVSLGKVGIVLMLEASRLARNNSDWCRLIEICGVSGTLIADESAVYNPREPNDRLLLGVKGTLSEAELFTLRTRLYEGRWNKARKGLLHFSLPGGLRASSGRRLGFWIGHAGSRAARLSFRCFSSAWCRPSGCAGPEGTRAGTANAINCQGRIRFAGMESAHS